MAATFGGIARAPFTAIIFLFELSRNPNALLPLVVCCMVSDGFVRLFSAESIMTGKLIKRGLIVRQDYTVPILMRGRIEEVMRKNFTVINADDDVQAVVRDVSPEQAGVIAVIEPDGAWPASLRPTTCCEASIAIQKSGASCAMITSPRTWATPWTRSHAVW